MDNPFLKRATDFMRDEEAFLAIVSPEPVSYFLLKPGKEHLLYDRLVIIRGAPGSGKTTLGRLFAYPSLAALLRNRKIDQHRALVVALNGAGAIEGDLPRVLGCRLQLETDYREFWEFPYPPELKLQLMMALIQARAVMAWMRNLTESGVPLATVSVVPRQDAEAATLAIGGVGAAEVVSRARAVERALYKVVGALVPPPIGELSPDCTDAYRPFDVIDHIRVRQPSPAGEETLDLQPLIILDDAHALHSGQVQGLQRWLARRELRVARWVLTRLDVLHPHEMLAAVTEDRSDFVQLPGITATRDTTEIMLQSSGTNRGPQRLAFRKMARDMADRYLGQMPLFAHRGLKRLSDMLPTQEVQLTASRCRELADQVSAAQTKLGISNERRASIEATIGAFEPGGKRTAGDLQLEMLSILMHRHAKRTANQRSLFQEDATDPEPSKPLSIDSAVVDAARIHLLHKCERPFYFGIDDLCDAGSENVEQFLRLAEALVGQVSTQITRGKAPSLDASAQHRLLRQRAADILSSWNFPHCQAVRRLIGVLGKRCRQVSLEPNAPLGYGANAYGIPQDDFDLILEQYPDLARVMQYGIAYSAFRAYPKTPAARKAMTAAANWSAAR